jgi:hypothetical protein
MGEDRSRRPAEVGHGVNRKTKRAGGEAERELHKRKLIAFDDETWHALQLLGRDSMKSWQELADEAFADLLKKHNRPASLKQALRESLRRQPANDPRPRDTKRRP